MSWGRLRRWQNVSLRTSSRRPLKTSSRRPLEFFKMPSRYLQEVLAMRLHQYIFKKNYCKYVLTTCWRRLGRQKRCFPGDVLKTLNPSLPRRMIAGSKFWFGQSFLKLVLKKMHTPCCRHLTNQLPLLRIWLEITVSNYSFFLKEFLAART